MMAGLLARHPRVSEWLYGFRTPEHGTVVLIHRRVYIVPSRLGWFFAGTLLILLVGSINYALSLGFALTFLLAGMGLVGMVHTTRNLVRMAVSAGRTSAVFAGESAQFCLYLDGRAAFDRPAILVRHLASGAQLVLDVPGGAIAEALLAVPAARRGWLPLGRVMLETRFPLGLFRAWSYVEPEARCLVYPRPERSALPRPSGEAAAGALRSAASTQPAMRESRVSIDSVAGRSCQSSQSSAPASPVNCLVSMSPVRATAFQATWRGESEGW